MTAHACVVGAMHPSQNRAVHAVVVMHPSRNRAVHAVVVMHPSQNRAVHAVVVTHHPSQNHAAGAADVCLSRYLHHQCATAPTMNGEHGQYNNDARAAVQ